MARQIHEIGKWSKEGGGAVYVHVICPLWNPGLKSHAKRPRVQRIDERQGDENRVRKVKIRRLRTMTKFEKCEEEVVRERQITIMGRLVSSHTEHCPTCKAERESDGTREKLGEWRFTRRVKRRWSEFVTKRANYGH